MRRALVLGGLLLCVALGASGTSVTILYTNDLHLRFQRLASIERLIAEARTEAELVLLFDAGDAWQDFRRPLPAVWGAEEMLSWMNRVGYDAMALGNHDLYWGAKRLEELSRAARFPLLCANLRPVPPTDAPFVSSLVLARGGIEVLAIGLITDEFLPYPSYPGLRFVPPAVAAHDEIEHARCGALIVVVAHLSVADAIDLARELPEIDVLISGHSHEATPEPIQVGKTLIVQSGAFGEHLGRLVLDVDPATGEHRLVRHDLIESEEAPPDLGRGLCQLFRVLFGLAIVAVLLLS